MNDERMARKARSRRSPRRAHPARLRATTPRSLKPATTSLAGKMTAMLTAIATTLTISRSPTWCAGVRTFYKSGEVPVRELERFHADGRSGELNRYVILKRL